MRSTGLVSHDLFMRAIEVALRVIPRIRDGKIESQDPIIRVWSDGGIDLSKATFHIEVLRSDFKRALTLVEQDLQAFLFSIESWTQVISFKAANQLFERFDDDFKIKTRSTELHDRVD